MLREDTIRSTKMVLAGRRSKVTTKLRLEIRVYQKEEKMGKRDKL